MSSYTSSLRKTMKLYKRLSIELLINTSIVNAFILYKLTTKKTISIVQFRTALVEHFIKGESDDCNTDLCVQRPRRLKHELKKRDGLVKILENTECNAIKIFFLLEEGRNKTKKVVIYCANVEHRYI